MPKSKLTAVLSLLFVFVSGGLLGALAQRAYILSRPAAAPNSSRRPSPAEFRQRYLTAMHDRLKLDDSQTAQLTKILNDVDDQMRQVQAKRHAEDMASPVFAKRNTENQALNDELVAKVNAILKPDQRVLYKQFREERERMRKQHEQQDQKNGMGPGGPPPPGPKM